MTAPNLFVGDTWDIGVYITHGSNYDISNSFLRNCRKLAENETDAALHLSRGSSGTAQHTEVENSLDYLGAAVSVRRGYHALNGMTIKHPGRYASTAAIYITDQGIAQVEDVMITDSTVTADITPAQCNVLAWNQMNAGGMAAKYDGNLTKFRGLQSIAVGNDTLSATAGLHLQSDSIATSRIRTQRQTGAGPYSTLDMEHNLSTKRIRLKANDEAEAVAVGVDNDDILVIEAPHTVRPSSATDGSLGTQVHGWKQLYLRSPDGSVWRVEIDNSGVINRTKM